MTSAEVTVLVVGATGRVGRHIVDGLLERGIRVRALARHPTAAGLPNGVEVAEADLYDPESVIQAAEGADSAFLLWPAFSSKGAAEVVDALAREVPHLVYLSAGKLQESKQGRPICDPIRLSRASPSHRTTSADDENVVVHGGEQPNRARRGLLLLPSPVTIKDFSVR